MLSKLESEDATLPFQQLFEYKFVDMNSRV
jgi:hypothetical protein